MNRYKSLLESSYGWNEIPNFFFMVFSIDNKAIKELQSKVMSGVKGISDSILIVKDFVSGGEAILIMDGQDLESINSISKIMYDNPNYLVSKNFSALKRMWSGGNLSHIFSNIFKHWMATTQYKDIKRALDEKNYYYRMSEYFDTLNLNIKTFNMFMKSFWEFFMSLSNSEDFYDRKLSDIIKKIGFKSLTIDVREAFIHIYKMYNSEGEWIIKDNKLKIPNNSKLLLMGSGNEERDKEYFGDALSTLSGKYDIKIVSMKDYEKMRNKVWALKDGSILTRNFKADKMFYSFFDLRDKWDNPVEYSHWRYG